MSLTATRLAFKHRTTVERDGQTSENDWGHPGTPDWDTSTGRVPCRAWINAGKEAVTTDRTAVIRDLRCMVPLDTDVTERDRLGDITEGDTVLFEGPHAIEAVLRHPDRLELLLEKVT